MNLMYFKNLRGDRDGGTTGLLSGSRRVTAGFAEGGGGSVGPSYSGVRGLGVGAGGGANSRSWFNAATSGGGVGGVAGAPFSSSSRGPGSGLSTSAGAATGAGGGGSGGGGVVSEMQHLRTHPLGLFDLAGSGRQQQHQQLPDYDEPDRASGGSRNSASAYGNTPAPTNNRWSNESGGSRHQHQHQQHGDDRDRSSNSRSDYRYTRVDRQRPVDSAVDPPPGGSRSVRSGLYDTEVCLSVSGLGNVRGSMVSGRTGKQVSFGRQSPDMSGGGSGTMERERSLRDSSVMDKRSRASSGNKENSSGTGSTSGATIESRSTFPRSSIVASKRPSPERLLAEPRSTNGGGSGSASGVGGGRASSREDSAEGRRRRTTSSQHSHGTAETSLSLPDTRPDPRQDTRHHSQRSGSRRSAGGTGADHRDRLVTDPNFDELIDPKDLNLNDIPRDCFIVPVHLVNRFLPTGATLPQTGRGPMSVVEVDDPQLVILLHFMTPFMAIQPVFESPLARPASLQGSMASQLLVDLLRDRPGAHGMLLVSIEQDVDYPYINYGVASRQSTNGEEWQQTARLSSLERFDPQNLRYFSDHLVDVYEEAITIARPPMQPNCRRPLSNKTGYIICVYKVFDGDDGEKFERNWLYWTGARILYQCVPRCVGLRRITLHKSVSAGDKLYTLMCECSSFMDHLQEAAYIAPALRARLCGYWSIYRIADVY